MQIKRIILGTALAALVGAAPALAQAPRTIEIKGTDDMKFSVTSITAKPGEQLRIVLTTVGSMPKMVMAHNWILLKLGADEAAFINASALARQTDFIAPAQKANVIASTKLAGAGEKVEVTFTVPKEAGKYPFVCSFPGHWAAGMKGVLTVK